MKLFLIPLLLGLSSKIWAQTSYVAPTKILTKTAYQLGVSADYFKSSEILDREGNTVEFTDGQSFTRLQSEVAGYYGLTENLQLGAGARFRQNASKAQNLIGEEETETSTGVESTFFNMIFAFKPVNRLYYTLEGTLRYRPYTNDEGADSNLVLGEQGNEYSVGMGVTYAFPSNNFLSGRVGYQKPGSDLSSEVYWQAEGALAWRYVALVAGVNGVSSLKNSPYEEESLNKPSYNTGVTSLYNSINREFIAPYAGINVALGKDWRVELRGSQVVSGQSTDLGTAFGVSLIRRVDDQNKGRLDKRFKEYDFEASVSKVSPKKQYLVIDKGLADDVRKGMKIDFFEFDYVGGNILLARGTVIKSKADTAIVKITHRYNTKKDLKEGIVARGSFR